MYRTEVNRSSQLYAAVVRTEVLNGVRN